MSDELMRQIEDVVNRADTENSKRHVSEQITKISMTLDQARGCKTSYDAWQKEIDLRKAAEAALVTERDKVHQLTCEKGAEKARADDAEAKLAEMSGEHIKWLCEPCNTIHPSMGEKFLQPCPTCGMAMTPTSMNLQRLKEIEAKLPKWVRVSERLPNTSGWYQVWFEGRSDQRTVFTCYFKSTDGTWIHQIGYPLTHWQPLPEAPRSGKSNDSPPLP